MSLLMFFYILIFRCECVYGMKKSSNGCTFVNNDCKERGHIFISEIGECREGNIQK